MRSFCPHSSHFFLFPTRNLRSNSGLTAAAASLSLSTSPPTTTPPVRSVQQLIQKQSSDASGDGNDEDSAPNAGSGRKKGVIYRCETCSKVGGGTEPRPNESGRADSLTSVGWFFCGRCTDTLTASLNIGGSILLRGERRASSSCRSISKSSSSK